MSAKTEIIKWQGLLKDKGHYVGKLDGIFGKGTLRASLEIAGIPEQEIDMSNVHTGGAEFVMANQNAIRNRRITDNLREKIISAVTHVYGRGARIVVYSGGQARSGSQRTGSVRHNDYGEGGRAADCYIYVNGRKLSGPELAKLGQYWLAMKYGAVGLEMATGGIHLDEWTTPPSGGGMYWTYKWSDGKHWGAKVRQMLQQGARGVKPS